MSGVDLGAMRSRWAAIVDDEERISFEAWTRRIYDFAKDALAALEELEAEIDGLEAEIERVCERAPGGES